MMMPPRSPTRNPLSLAWSARCPRCNEGRLFRGFLTPVDRCEACGLPIAALDSGDGPAVFLVFVLGAVGVALTLVLEVWGGVPLLLNLLITAAIVAGGAATLLRPLKAYVIALAYRHGTDSGATPPPDRDTQGDC